MKRTEERQPTAVERQAAERGELFLRMYSDGMTYKQIAKAEGISIASVARVLRSARDRRERSAA